MQAPDADILRIVVFVAAVLLLLLWERAAPWRRTAGRLGGFATNIGLGGLNTLLLRLLLPWLAIDAALWAQSHGTGLLPRLTESAALQVVAGVLLLDLAMYAQHRIFHAVPWLWRLHAVHHSDPHLDVSSGLRFHPLEILLSMLWKIALVVALGAPVLAVVAFEVLLSTLTLFNHANIRLPSRLDAALRQVLITPAMHHVHHSQLRTECDSNYGFGLSWWDSLFGTRHANPGTDPATLAIGLPGVPESAPPGLVRLLTARIM
jgi:sterol desaturase/sphingolipid hydroxylase (fatty acid hydroxylase superfamily)